MDLRPLVMGPIEHENERQPVLEGPIELLLDLPIRDVPHVVIVQGLILLKAELLHHVLCPGASLSQRLKLLIVFLKEVSKNLNVEVFEF